MGTSRGEKGAPTRRQTLASVQEGSYSFVVFQKEVLVLEGGHEDSREFSRDIVL